MSSNVSNSDCGHKRYTNVITHQKWHTCTYSSTPRHNKHTYTHTRPLPHGTHTTTHTHTPFRCGLSVAVRGLLWRGLKYRRCRLSTKCLSKARLVGSLLPKSNTNIH